MKVNREAIQEVLTIAKRLDAKGVLTAYEGNISVKRDGLIYATPSGQNKGFLTEEMIAIVDEDGNQLGGKCKVTSELKLHLHAYRVRENIGGVVHSHSPYLTAHAICGLPIRTKAYSEIMIAFGSIEIAGYGRPGTDDIYREIGPLLQKSDVILLENHGAMAVGTDAFHAMNNIETAESTAKVLTLARTIGKEKPLSDEESAALWAMHAQRQGY